MQEKIEELVENVKEYVNTQYELSVLKATNKASHLLSDVLAKLIVSFFCVLAILLLSFALAYYISAATNDTYSGFFLVGGVYLVIGLLLFGFRKWLIERPLGNKMIRNFLKE